MVSLRRMSKKMIPVTKAYIPSLDEFVNNLRPIWESGVLTNNGAAVKSLESALANKLSVSNLKLVCNATIGLQLVLNALGVKGEVITTPFSYVATTNSILWERCKPVFADIDPLTFNIAPENVEKAITDGTTAILATHVYGNPCDLEALQKIASRHSLKLIYDCAHGFGVRVGGRSLLSYGDCSVTSLHATKLFHTVEGGLVVSNNRELINQIDLNSRFGHEGEESYTSVGINAKMSELHAAVGLTILPKLEEIVAHREQISNIYDSGLTAEIYRPKPEKLVDYNYAYYPILLRDEIEMLRVRDELKKNNVHPRRYFHPSLNLLPFLPLEERNSCPISESVASRVLCLPIYPGLKTSEVDMIVRTVNTVAGK